MYPERSSGHESVILVLIICNIMQVYPGFRTMSLSLLFSASTTSLLLRTVLAIRPVEVNHSKTGIPVDDCDMWVSVFIYTIYRIDSRWFASVLDQRVKNGWPVMNTIQYTGPSTLQLAVVWKSLLWRWPPKFKRGVLTPNFGHQNKTHFNFCKKLCKK